MVKFDDVFKRGADGRVIPEITPEAQWILSTDNGLMTIKIDGICVRAYWQLPQGNTATAENNWGWVLERKLKDGGWAKTNPTNPHDAPIYTAWKNMEIRQDGIFEVYGKDIKGNPHNLSDNFMIRIIPVEYSLIVAKGVSRIYRGPAQTARGLYDTIKAEFLESPDIEGLVFHLEDVGMKLKSAARVTKKDFGMPWPEPKVTIDMSTSNIIPAV